MSQYNLVILLLLLAGVLLLFIAYLSFRKHRLAVTRYSGLAMFASAVYAIGYAFELMSPTLEGKRVWLMVEYIGISFIPVFWLLLALHYTGYHTKLKPQLTPLLFVIPSLTLLMHYTNDYHHLFYASILPPGNPAAPLQLEHGFWFWIHVSYSYLHFAVTIALYILSYLRSNPVMRKQIAVLLAGGLAPIMTNVLYVFGTGDGRLDLTPLGFAVTGVAHIWGIYKFNLLRLVPIAIQQVYDTMKDGVIIIDYDDNMTDINQAASHMFPQLLPIRDSEHSIHDVLKDVPELLAVLNQNEHHENQVRIARPGGTRYYSVKVSTLHDSSQAVIGRMLLLSDMTSMVRDQEALSELGGFKDKLFTTIAHDIRDPLAILMNLMELLEEEAETAWKGDTRLIREVRDEVKRTYMLVEGLLDWYRSQAGKAIYAPTAWDLAEIALQAADTMQNRSLKKHVTVHMRIEKGTLVIADKEMIGLVLRNLLSNSIKFTPPGGTVTISAVVIDARINVSVADNGIGMEPGASESLFHRIQQQPETSTDGEPGAGLGLYLSAKLIQLHGGEIWCQSSPGEGSLFTFSLSSA
ncbi:histidine kinase N-terminal 7TM domain-containing protein [Paenibacillus sp. 1P07SE]|uniref:sensor histidine kinase n=1 Tax=Paenibacillus sp. 1P07SE TaxID=3132209 RepID=UPI0039A5FD28